MRLHTFIYNPTLLLLDFAVSNKQNYLDPISTNGFFSGTSSLRNRIWSKPECQPCYRISLFAFYVAISGCCITYAAYTRYLVWGLTSNLVCTTLVAAAASVGVVLSLRFRTICLLAGFEILSTRTQMVIYSYALGVALVAWSNIGENFRALFHRVTCAFRLILGISWEELRSVLQLEAIKQLMQDAQELVDQLQEQLEIVEEFIHHLENSIRAAREWLENLIEDCNNIFGHPFDRCNQVFQDAEAACIDQIGDSFAFLCQLDVFQSICTFAQGTQQFCSLPDSFREIILDPITEEFYRTKLAVLDYFDAGIHFEHSIELNMTVDNDPIHIISHLMAVTHALQNVFSFDLAIFILPLSLTTMALLSATYYTYGYLHWDRFDNRYISKTMIEFDIKRIQEGQEGIFPLTYKENSIYVKVSDFRWLRKEYRKFKIYLLLFLMVAVPLLLVLLLDRFLYIITLLDVLSFVEADLVHGLSHLLRTHNNANLSSCKEPGSPPNAEEHYIAVALLGLSLLISVGRAHFLRFRHLITDYFNPVRKMQREVWLYQHIASSRSKLLAFAYKKIKWEIKHNHSAFNISWFRRFISRIGYTQQYCFLCGKEGSSYDADTFHTCPNCTSVLCIHCYRHSGGRCIICSEQDPDIDIDSESGSSENFDEDFIHNTKSSDNYPLLT